MNIAPSPRGAGAYMAHHSRSFRLATLILGRESRGRIERVYAWCRHTDDIVDTPQLDAASAEQIDVALDDWLARSRAAYNGESSGIPLLDMVMREMHDGGASFGYAEALVNGVRSDLRFRPFDSMTGLRAYTHEVASVVGLWLCALHGVSDSWMLDRAAALGHAMQLTNILRDVGEDLGDGRIYLPLDLMGTHRVTPFDLRMMRAGRRPVVTEYRELMEDLMQRAEDDYRFAAEAVPHLPSDFARSVAIASTIYAGIHDEIRANGYDNVTMRARVSLVKKLDLSARALRRLSNPPRATHSGLYTAGAGSWPSMRNASRGNANRLASK